MIADLADEARAKKMKIMLEAHGKQIYKYDCMLF